LLTNRGPTCAASSSGLSRGSASLDDASFLNALRKRRQILGTSPRITARNRCLCPRSEARSAGAALFSPEASGYSKTIGKGDGYEGQGAGAESRFRHGPLPGHAAGGARRPCRAFAGGAAVRPVAV